MTRAISLLLSVALVVAVFACDDPDTTIPTMPVDAADSGGDPAGDPTPDSLDAAADTTMSETGTPDVTADLSAEESTEELSDTPSDLPAFRTCTDRAFEPSHTGEWNHPVLTGGTLLLGGPGHSIEDLVHTWVQPNRPLVVEGKFAYGTVSKDLEDEWVAAYVDNCDDWVDLGQDKTDTDGRVRFNLPESVQAQPGRYEVQMVVQGDGTIARGYVLVVPPVTQFVVFDIDGTLTTGDSELAGEILADLFGGDYVPEAYADGDTITSQYSEAGYEIIYLTARPYWLSGVSREWLEDLGYPRGTTHYTLTLGEALPTEDGTGAYKRDYLLGVVDEHVIFRAYGNSDTDIFAFLEAGVIAEDVYIIGENGGMDGTQAIESYTDHLIATTIPAADQPFER